MSETEVETSQDLVMRRHCMPFGAELQPDGAVRFRLWAPGAEQVALCIEDPGCETRLSLTRGEGGWFELVTAIAREGTHYWFQVDGGARVSDPASRFQPRDVHGPSEVIDPEAFRWQDSDWHGRPWEEVVLYELHVGAFTAEGRFQAVVERLDYLVDLGVTALELMPIADFPGRRNWGYDGVLLFAPESSYGRPEELKELVQTAHAKGLMVFLDVVYNHFGPEGNYLHLYAPDFFSTRHHTPWGVAVNFDRDNSRTVRDFFIHNALYWLEEYHFDGLRLDAVHAIQDGSKPDILEELAEAVHAGPGAQRHVHLVLENVDNKSKYLERREDGSPHCYTAQWNDDIQGALHVLTTGECDGHYLDFKDRPARHLGRCLTEGFAFQGEPSRFRNGLPRGEPSAHLPATGFVSFLQNHDQVGNRPFGERIDRLTQPEALRAALAIVLLAPSLPLLFMGQEFCASSPFLYFCDFEADLARAVTEGRRRAYARLTNFASLEATEATPDPNAPDCFERSKLDWASLDHDQHRAWFNIHRDLLAVRHREIVPRLFGLLGGASEFELIDDLGLIARWRLGDGSLLTLLANLRGADLSSPRVQVPAGELLYATPWGLQSKLALGRLSGWGVAWFLDRRDIPNPIGASRPEG